MSRKTVIAIAVTAAIGAAVALAPTLATARGGGGGLFFLAEKAARGQAGRRDDQREPVAHGYLSAIATDSKGSTLVRKMLIVFTAGGGAGSFIQ